MNIIKNICCEKETSRKRIQNSMFLRINLYHSNRLLKFSKIAGKISKGVVHLQYFVADSGCCGAIGKLVATKLWSTTRRCILIGSHKCVIRNLYVQTLSTHVSFHFTIVCRDCLEQLVRILPHPNNWPNWHCCLYLGIQCRGTSGSHSTEMLCFNNWKSGMRNNLQ